MTEAPEAEAMSREGKGTQAASETGRGQPLSWSEAERRRRLVLARHRTPGRWAARDATVRGVVRHVILSRQQEPGTQEPQLGS